VFGPFCAAGGTVILSRHGRKSGGTLGDAARGSSAIEGAADTIVHLTRPSGQDAEVRQLEAIGRFDMPERLLIRRKVQLGHLHTPSVLDGDKVEPRYIFERVIPTGEAESPRARILICLLAGAKTTPEIAEVTGLSPRTVNRTIHDMGEEVGVIGKGGTKKNAPIYGLKTRERTLPSQSLRDVHVKVPELDGRMTA
jgi:hypothetical protein